MGALEDNTGATSAIFGNSTGPNGDETVRKFCDHKISSVRFLHDQSEYSSRFVTGTWCSPAGSGGNVTLWTVQQQRGEQSHEGGGRIVQNGRIELPNCDVGDICVVNAQQFVVSTTAGDVQIVESPLASNGANLADGIAKISSVAKYPRVHKFASSTALCLLDEEIFSGSDSGQIIRIRPDSQSSQSTRPFAQDLTGVTSLTVCGTFHLVSAHKTGQLHLWDVRNWPSAPAIGAAAAAEFGHQPVLSRSVTTLNNSITALATHPAQPNLIAFGSQDGVVSFVDIRQVNRQLPVAFKVSQHPISRIKFHPIFANNFFSSSDSGLIHWDASALAQGANLNPPTNGREMTGHESAADIRTTGENEHTNIWLSPHASTSVNLRVLIDEDPLLLSSFDVVNGAIVAASHTAELVFMSNDKFTN
ncbi:hypothetical protein niasHS_006816 [Heterodera schachtii]|uniref:Nucleoporin Nup43 n=1 Tax=Heterodera schachtii TaxID=97005 RepID=A0ABD2JIB0_HETSC